MMKKLTIIRVISLLNEVCEKMFEFIHTANTGCGDQSGTVSGNIVDACAFECFRNPARGDSFAICCGDSSISISVSHVEFMTQQARRTDGAYDGIS